MPRYRYKHFKGYWDDLTAEQRRLLADLSGVPYNYLARIACGDRKPGIGIIMALGKVDRSITPRLLRPDLAGTRAPKNQSRAQRRAIRERNKQKRQYRKSKGITR